MLLPVAAGAINLISMQSYSLILMLNNDGHDTDEDANEDADEDEGEDVHHHQRQQQRRSEKIRIPELL